MTASRVKYAFAGLPLPFFNFTPHQWPDGPQRLQATDWEMVVRRLAASLSPQSFFAKGVQAIRNLLFVGRAHRNFGSHTMYYTVFGDAQTTT